jgi:hypothetical protein
MLAQYGLTVRGTERVIAILEAITQLKVELLPKSPI